MQCPKISHTDASTGRLDRSCCSVPSGRTAAAASWHSTRLLGRNLQNRISSEGATAVGTEYPSLAGTRPFLLMQLHTRQLVTTGARMHCSCLHAALAECCTECVRLGGAMLSDTLQQQQLHNTAALLSRYRCPEARANTARHI